MKNNYRHLYIKYNEFIFPVALSLAAVALFFFVIINTGQQAIGTFQDAQTIEDQNSGLASRLAVLDKLDESTLQQQLQSSTQAVPLDKSLPTILRTIEGIAVQSQVSVSNLAVLEPGSLSTKSAQQVDINQQKYGAALLPFTVAVTGSIDQIKTFIDLTTKVRRFLMAQSFIVNFIANAPTQSVQSSSSGQLQSSQSAQLTNSPQLSTQMGFSAFYIPLPNGSPPDNTQPLSPDQQALINTISAYPNMGDSAVGQSSLAPAGGKQNPFAP